MIFLRHRRAISRHLCTSPAAEPRRRPGSFFVSGLFNAPRPTSATAANCAKCLHGFDLFSPPAACKPRVSGFFRISRAKECEKPTEVCVYPPKTGICLWISIIHSQPLLPRCVENPRQTRQIRLVSVDNLVDNVDCLPEGGQMRPVCRYAGYAALSCKSAYMPQFL